MNRGRRYQKQVASEQDFTLEECQSIAQVVSLRGSKVIDAKGDNSSALFKLKKRRSGRSRNLLIMGSFLGLFLTQQERRRRRRRRRGGGSDISTIPMDLVMEILSRLPAKYLVRLKCVSKQWSSLISSRYFCDRLFTFTRGKQQEPRLYMCLVDEGGQRVLLSMSSTSPDKTCFVVDQDLSIPGMGGFFLNGLHGLMCFSERKKACIYNPSTRQRLTFPKIKSDIKTEEDQWRHHTMYYIGHDPVNDQYKLFCTIVISSDYLFDLKSEHWVFVLKAGGSWKKLVPGENYHPHVPFALGRSIGGSIVHYLAWHDMHTCSIVSFDVRSEEFTAIIVPEDVSSYVSIPADDMRADLIEYGGKIAIFEHSHLKYAGVAELWVLEDSEKQEWSKTSLVLQPCQRHLVNGIEMLVKGTTKEGKVILAPWEMHSGFYILFYDLQGNDLTKVEIKGVPQLWFDNECYIDLRLMDESESAIYLET